MRQQEFLQAKRRAALREQLAGIFWRGIRNIRLARVWRVHNEWMAARQEAAPMQLESSSSGDASSAGPSGLSPSQPESGGGGAEPISQQTEDCCAMPGCSRPRFEDPSGRRHRCCGRTCARELARVEHADVCDALRLDAEARGSRKARDKPKGARGAAKRGPRA